MKTELFSLDKFKNPPAECAPCYAWAWNAPVTREEIDRQLDDFCRAGIRSLCMIPFPPEFRPTLMKTRLSPPYLSAEFFSLVSYAYHRAAALGMALWIYDEGGWPSGGACGHTLSETPEAATDVLFSREVMLARGEIYRESEGTIASFFRKKRIRNGYVAECPTLVTEFFTKALTENGNRVDYTNLSVTHTFINNTYEPYKAAMGDLFGNAIPLIFTDEPGQMPHSVPKGFFEEFEKEYGYDLRDRLYAVCDPLCEDENDRIARIDYARLIGKLMRDRFFRPLSDWCEKNGISFGGHLDNEHITGGGTRNGYFSHLDCLHTFGIPGIDVIWDQIRYPKEDNSAVCEGIPFFPRLAPSAARQIGKNLALSETFSVYGESFYPDEVRYVIGYQAIRGINCFNFLSIPYGKDRLAALAMRPGFCPEKPGFFHLKAINEYTERLSYLLRLGEPTADTALYFPAADIAASAQSAKAADISYVAEGASLEARHIAFDIIDDNTILSSVDTGEGLAIGNALYKHIVVPKCKYMQNEVYKKAKKYFGCGAPSVSIQNPSLRSLVRKIDESALWFFFNEGLAAASEHVPLPEGKRAYRLDLSLGGIFSVGNDGIDLSLSCGETAVYLITEKTYVTEAEDRVFSVTADQFRPLYMDRFEVFAGGIRKLRCPVPDRLPHDLSAEITYECDYALPAAPKKGEVYEIALSDTKYTASLQIDGKTVAVFGPSPMIARIDGGLLQKSGTLTVTVANTASGEIAKKRALIEDFYPEEEQGVYAKRKMYALEASYEPPRIGALSITLLSKK